MGSLRGFLEDRVARRPAAALGNGSRWEKVSDSKPCNGLLFEKKTRGGVAFDPFGKMARIRWLLQH